MYENVFQEGPSTQEMLVENYLRVVKTLERLILRGKMPEEKTFDFVEREALLLE